MVATMNKEALENYGSILQCGRDLGSDHGTLYEVLCSVVMTMEP